ncbi:GNAT family N-acetyltransferase [Streptomyces sp. MB09-01]|uniref:GNAT family N-acetyltransferase n=1 Tax=Streptomyces sp. MB09-01 TaxID=3028666 RepID=UPI0029A46E68|nr:GNAT family N-acetyltransferase [Streptomyces sp. MB09-01]MDX3537874.1 GNAT family N-acetyltransferase [Streptomyces sp. MB09-01]
MDILELAPGEPLGEARAAATTSLFRSAYHKYHYLTDLHSSDRHRFLILDGDRVVGFASARAVGRRAVLANLVVHPKWRGTGLGRALETARCTRLRGLGLFLYTSCTCEDDSSQRLKWDMGMRPTVLRLGYRCGVTRPGTWGTSVVFTDETPEVGEVGPDRLHEDTVRDRIRWIGEVPPPALLRHVQGFAEIMTGESGAAALDGDGRVVYAGVDLDLATGTWLYCFQLRNAAFLAGAAERPVVLRTPPGVLVPLGPLEAA